MFAPPHRNIRKKLKKLQNELGIPSHLRDRCIVLEYQGEIVWVEGIGPSQRFCPQKNTETVAFVDISAGII